jgi:predicted kinase
MNTLGIDINPSWIFPYCPESASLPIDWVTILATFPCLKSLATCEQNSLYYAEKNTWIHTQLVCEALVSLPAWQAMNQTDRSILFAAALFHDLAKSLTRQVVEDGKITAKEYVNSGMRMVRQILQDLQTPFAIREAIVAIVRYESLPLLFWDKSNPLQAIIRTSQFVRCDWLALIAEAAIRGRGCQDREQLLERVDFFREFCQEYHCFDRSYQFASNLSRFIYFQKEDGDPTYEAYDDTRLEVILMCGLPGTGKDYWIADRCTDLPVISLDRLRMEKGILPTDPQGQIVQAGRDLAKRYLQSETPFIWNATNIVKPIRSSLIGLFAGYRARVRIVYLEVPFDRVLKQNRNRLDRVPEEVIYRYRDRLEIPNVTEAHHVDYFVEV